VVNISGGTLGENFENSSGSNVELIGGEFRINGEVYSGGTINSIDGDVFTGTLADGSPFIFLDLDPGFFLSSDSFLEPVTLTSVPLAPADTPPMQVDSGSSDKPTGLRPGQDLTLQSGGELDDNFEAVGAILRIRGGILGEGATVVDSTVSISHGELDDLTALSNSVVNYRRGDVSELNIVDSQLNILGGAISRDISRLQVGDDSFVTLFGTEFFLNGAPIPFLDPPFTITDRAGELSGVLLDETNFSIDLSDFTDGFSVLARLRVAEPLLGDCNFSSDVTFLDIAPFIARLSSQEYLPQADCNMDGEITFLDIAPFIVILASQ